MRYLTFNAAFLPTSRNTFKCHVFIFHTNCLPFGFSSPVTGREEACLFQGCRLVTRSAGKLPVAVYIFIEFFLVLHLNLHLWDQTPTDERVFYFSWIINYLFRKVWQLPKWYALTETRSFFFLLCSELKSLKAKVKILS